VDEAEHRGVKREALHLDRIRLGIAVEGVGEHRVAKVGEVDTHLVGASGTERCLDE
jgi:hypothetical protein